MFRVQSVFLVGVMVGVMGLCDVSAFAASNVVNVSATKMKYGPKGKKTSLANQCWTKSDMQEYAQCLFPSGVRSGNNDIIKVELNSVQIAPAQQQYEK